MFIQPLFGVRVASFIIAIIIFWFFTEKAKREKKKSMDSFISLLATWFVLFFSIKFVTKWEIFIDNPMAVLAYPSGTQEFYIASVILMLFAWIKRADHLPRLYDYILMLSIGIFSYTVIARLGLENGHWVDLVLAAVFLLGTLLFRNPYWLVVGIGVISGVTGLFIYTPTILGYRMHAGFYLLMAGLVLVLTFRKKRERQENNSTGHA
ncbi:hypothetical protein ACGTN9_10035 [Halobacillus sp. MO56]